MRRRWIISILLISALPSMLFGQAQTTGRISGRVVDDAGSAISGAEITARNTELDLERTAVSGSTGEFLLGLLPTGPYLVTVTAPGRQPEVYNLRVGVGQTIPLQVRLAAGEAMAETITVTAAASALETTQVGENFSFQEEVERLPIADRGLEEVATLAPNVSFGPTPGSIAFAGAPSFDTTVLVDGAEVSDPYFGSAPDLLLEDAVEEIQVITSGVSARYGRFQGGVINAITRSGTNEFSGTLRSEFESQSWNSVTPFGESQADTVQQTYQATLGGPILRDRLWFFGGLRKIPTADTVETTSYTGEPIARSRDEQRWIGKLRGALTARHLLDYSFSEYESESSNYVGLTAGDDLATGTRTDPRTYQTLTYQGVLGDSTFLEAQATRKQVKILSGGDPAKGDPFLENRTTTMFNNHWWDYTDPSIRDNETLSLTGSHALTNTRFGTHRVEAGLQRVLSTTGGDNRQSSTGLNLLALNASTLFYAGQENGVPRFNVVTGEAVRWSALALGGDQEMLNTALYVEDVVSFDRLRLDLGLRWESYDGEGPDPSFNLDFAGLAPRLGVTYNLTPRWQVQGTYGRYISRFNDRSVNNITGISAAPRITTLYNGPTIMNATAAQVQEILRNEAYWQQVVGYTGPAQPTTFIDSDIKPPHADDYNLSLRHALPNNVGSLVLSYIHRDYKQLLDDFRGDVCDYGFDFGQPCPTGNITTIRNPTSGATLGRVDTIVWANAPDAKREYRALTAVGEYRPSRRWHFAGNYTYSTTKANYEGEGRNTPASGSIIGDYPRSIDVAAAVPFGYADDDIRHRLIGTGTFTLDLARAGDLSFGSILTYQSGFPYSLTAPVALRPDPGYASESGNYNHFFGPNGEIDQSERGSRRFDDRWTLDLSVRYHLPLVSGMGLFIRAIALNATDNAAVIQHQTSGRAVIEGGRIVRWEPIGTCGLGSKPSTTCSGFGRIRNEDDYQDPREYLLSIGLTF